MSTIQVTDRFGIDINVETGNLSSITKYFSSLPRLSLADFNLNSIAGLTLDDPAVKSVAAGLDFSQPVAIGSDLTLRVNAGISGALRIFVPASGGSNLFTPDLYGDNIAVASDDRFVSISVTATAGPEIDATANELAFGFAAGATVCFSHYRRFATQPAAPSVIDAVVGTLADFSIPGGLEDLRQMPVDSLLTVEGIGSVTVKGSANLLAAVNPLAALSLPAPLPSLQLSAGGSVTVGATCQIAWDYQIRIRKLDANRITLGFYRKRGTETSVSVQVEAGVSPLSALATVIGLVSPDAQADASELARAGLSPGQITGMQSAVQSAAQRKLEVALLASLTAADSVEAAFLYEFDLAALEDAGTQALGAALRGDLVSLDERTLPAGVRMLRSILTDSTRTAWTWKLNLLGIYNYTSISDLARQGTILFEPVTGDLVITDTATARQLAISNVNFGADSAKLRHLMAGSFLATAVYRGSKTAIPAPHLQCSHTFFELSAATDRRSMMEDLDAALALGLLDDVGAARLLGAENDFGRTVVYAETSYDDATARALFLDGTTPKTAGEYENAGRGAIQLLVRPGDPDEYRRLAALDDDLWARMRDAGPFNFAPLFPGFSDLQVQVVAADYTVIVWWADAMSTCAARLAAMDAQLAANPDPASAGFVALREDLAKHLADVAGRTREEFGRPWGLIAMDLVAGRRASACVRIAGSHAAFAADRLSVTRASHA